MTKRILDGMFVGAGFVIVVGVAFAIAWAGDIFTIDKDGVPKFVVSDAGKITVGATESYVNLVIQNDGTTPNDKVTITADVLTVEGIRLEGLNVSADITAAVGAGGRDTNFADAANTWYYVWIITNNDGTLKNGILTLAPATPNPPTPPVLPSGFTKKRRVGAVRNDASSNFLQFAQEGNFVAYSGTNNSYVLSAGREVVFTPVPLANYMPPTSRRTYLGLTLNPFNTAPQIYYGEIRKTGSASIPLAQVQASVQAANQQDQVYVHYVTDTDGAQSIDYRLGANRVPSVGGLYITVEGYYDRI